MKYDSLVGDHIFHVFDTYINPEHIETIEETYDQDGQYYTKVTFTSGKELTFERVFPQQFMEHMHRAQVAVNPKAHSR